MNRYIIVLTGYNSIENDYAYVEDVLIADSKEEAIEKAIYAFLAEYEDIHRNDIEVEEAEELI